MIIRSIDSRDHPYLPNEILWLSNFLVYCLRSLPAERDPLTERFLGAVFEFVHEAPLPTTLVLLYSGAHPEEQQQVLRELTQRGEFLTQQEHHLKLEVKLDFKENWIIRGVY